MILRICFAHIQIPVTCEYCPSINIRAKLYGSNTQAESIRLVKWVVVMDTSSEPSFLTSFKRWVKVGNNIPNNELPALERHAQVIKQRLQQEASLLVKEAAG